MTEPDWYADDFDSWGDPDDWPPDWHIKAKAALIRHFSRIDVKVEYLGSGKFSIKLPHQSALEFRIQSATDYLDGFLEGCERMAQQWDCRERTETADEAPVQLAAIKALHTPTNGHNPECHCGIPPHADRSCIECRTSWPCATIRALTPGDTK